MPSGSNIANVGLILGLTALIYPLKVERVTLKREFPVLGVIMLVTLALMWNLNFSRIDGLILIGRPRAAVGGMVVLGLTQGKAIRSPATLVEEVPQDMPTRTAVMWTLLGLVLLPLSAHILVNGAIGLATIVGVSEAVVGLTIVALGTSLPELAAAAACAFRKEDDLAIGNILGSNMFNLLGVLGIAALIHPMEIEAILLHRDVLGHVRDHHPAVRPGLASQRTGLIGRPTALLLFAGYIGYQSTVIRPGACRIIRVELFHMVDPQRIHRAATEVLETEARAILALADRIDDHFVAACEAHPRLPGHLIVTGMGKSGTSVTSWPQPWPPPAHRHFSCIRPKPATATWA
jgi:cation:H+ antiporter